MKAKSCYFCTNMIDDIDYKDTRLLQRFMSSYAKIVSRRRSGTCTTHQRKLSQAVKRARFMALVPFTLR
jgi:small subunit ribosomal protein S18